MTPYITTCCNAPAVDALGRWHRCTSCEHTFIPSEDEIERNRFPSPTNPLASTMQATDNKLLLQLATSPARRKEYDALHGEGTARELVAQTIGEEYVHDRPIRWSDRTAVDMAIQRKFSLTTD